MHCENFVDLISGHIDGINNESEEALLLEHLQHCDHCRALLDAYRSIDTLIAQEDAVPPLDLKDHIMQAVRCEPKKHRNHKRLFWGIGSGLAAAACLALVITALPSLRLAKSDHAAPAEAENYAMCDVPDSVLNGSQGLEKDSMRYTAAAAPTSTEKKHLSLPKPGESALTDGMLYAPDTLEAAPVLVIWNADPKRFPVLNEKTQIDGLKTQVFTASDDSHADSLYGWVLQRISEQSADGKYLQAITSDLTVYAYETSFDEMNTLFSDYAGLYEMAVYYPAGTDHIEPCTVLIVNSAEHRQAE